MNRYDRYNKKCKFVSFRLRKGIDDEYIDFLNNCKNKTEFLREAIKKELNKN